MKITKVFGIVLLVHAVAIAAILVQPGCKTLRKQQTEDGATAIGEPSPVADSSVSTAESAGRGSTLDPAFNAGLGGASAQTRKPGRYEPTRPVVPEGDDVGFDQELGVLEPVGTEPPGEVDEYYTVVRGDTLSGIARQQGIPLQALLDANGLSKEDLIYVGQELTIPG